MTSIALKEGTIEHVTISAKMVLTGLRNRFLKKN